MTPAPPYDAPPPANERRTPTAGGPVDTGPPTRRPRVHVPPTNGAGSPGEPPAAEEPHNPADTERTQYVERRPAAETTHVDPSGYEGYAEGGYPSYAPYPPPQQYGPPGSRGLPIPQQQASLPGQQYGTPPARAGALPARPPQPSRAGALLLRWALPPPHAEHGHQPMRTRQYPRRAMARRPGPSRARRWPPLPDAYPPAASRPAGRPPTA